MGCCRKARPMPTVPKRPTSPLASMATSGGGTPGAPMRSPICDTIESNGTATVLIFMRGSIVFLHEGTKFELFSAITSQRCTVPWGESLHKAWLRLTPAKREQAVKRIGKDEFTVEELITSLA